MFDAIKRLFKPLTPVATAEPKPYTYYDPLAGRTSTDPSILAPFLSARDLDVLTRTLYGEARSEPDDGVVAVVHVVRNRALARRTDAATECLRPWQFSCWNQGDPNLAKLRALKSDDPHYVRLSNLARKAWDLPDITRGAKNYYAPKGMPGGKPPGWASAPGARETLKVGGHIFIAGI